MNLKKLDWKVIFNLEKLEEIYNKIIQDEINAYKNYLLEDTTVDDVKKIIPLEEVMDDLMEIWFTFDWELTIEKNVIPSWISMVFGDFNFDRQPIKIDHEQLSYDEWHEKYILGI